MGNASQSYMYDRTGECALPTLALAKKDSTWFTCHVEMEDWVELGGDWLYNVYLNCLPSLLLSNGLVFNKKIG